MLENRLETLDLRFRTKVEQLLAELMRQRIYVVVTETLRSPERQQFLYDQGKTKTPDKSKHLMNAEGTGAEAIDMYPVAAYSNGKVTAIEWNAHPVWMKIGELAEKLGIAWGGRWTSFPDYGHFEEWAEDDAD